jgi:large subunit ribosomal protein L32e
MTTTAEQQQQQQQGQTPQQQTLSKQELTRLLELRRLKKEKTPEFQRQESWRYVRIHDAWRKPKGVDSHMRLSVKGWPALVKIGYRGPRAVRGLHPSGLRDVLVHNMAELETLSPNADAARFAAGVGRRKRIDLARRAKEMGIRVLNGRGLLMGERIQGEEEGEERRPSPKEEEETQEAPTATTTSTTVAEEEERAKSRAPHTRQKKKKAQKKAPKAKKKLAKKKSPASSKKKKGGSSSSSSKKKKKK